MTIFGWFSGSNTNFRHRTAYGHTFDFSLAKQRDGRLRIYITHSPSYGSRATDGHSTHRYYDTMRGHYICIRDDLAPTNATEAQDWARYWAENTSSYIVHGKDFS